MRASDDAEGAPPSRARRTFPLRFVTPLLWGTSLNPVNTSIIATSLVAIGASFGVGPGQTAVLVSAVYVASAVAQPAMGRLGQEFGPRRVFLAGLALITVAGAVGMFAPSFGWLVVSRVLIGIGTSAGYPSAMSLIRSRAEAAGVGVPGGVLGAVSIAGQATAALGLPLGGALVGLGGWPAVFAVNVPLGLAGVAMTLRWIPADRPIRRRPLVELMRAIDPIGILLFAVSIVSLIVFLSDVHHPAWWLLALAALPAGALVFWERRAPSPFIDVRMLAANGPLMRTYLRQALILMGAYAVMYGYVQWLEEGRGLGAGGAGLVLFPMSVVAALGAALIARRAAIRMPLLVSAIATIAGAIALALVDSTTNVVLLIGVSLVFGVVLGLTSTSNQAALYAQAPAAQMGVASGLFRTSTYLGAILASAVIALAYPQAPTDDGLHLIAVVIGCLGVVVLLLVALDRRIPRHGG